MALSSGEDIRIPFFINETDLLAGTAQEVITPVAGFVKSAHVIIQKAVTTGGDITFKIADTAVPGLTITVADAATKGTVISDEPTVGPPSDRAVEANERLQIVPAAAFATAGAVNGYLIVNTGK